MRLRKTDAGVYPDLETLSLSTDPEFLELIQRARARQAEEGSLSSVEMRRRLSLQEESGSSR
jgi:hypothetical protein